MNELNTAQQKHQEDDADEISFLDLGIIIGKQKVLIFGLPLLVGVLMALYSLTLPPIYTAKTTLISPSSGGGGGAFAALAKLGGLEGGIPALGGGSSADTYISMLKSRSVKDQVIDKFDLVNRYQEQFRSDLYARLDGVVRVSSDKKSGLITIEADDTDPAFAASLANGYFDALTALSSRVAVTDAQKRRVFYEGQFEKAKNDLSNAEVAMKTIQEDTGLLELEKQAEASITEVAQYRGEIAQREVQLSAIRTFATSNNPDYRRLSAEIQQLKAQLAKAESRSDKESKNRISVGNLPEQGLEYVRTLRNLKYQEALYQMMAKQLEVAKLEEANDGGSIQQLDTALPPERKSKPKRLKMVIAAGLIAGVIALIIALLRNSMSRNGQTPRNRKKIDEFKTAWKFGALKNRD